MPDHRVNVPKIVLFLAPNGFRAGLVAVGHLLKMRFEFHTRLATFRGLLVGLWMAIGPFWLYGAPEEELLDIESELEERYVEALSLLNTQDEETLKKAPKLLKKLAVSGHARSQHTLGTLYRYGIGVIESSKQAIRWYTEAADQSFPAAMLSLAESYIEGLGVEKDYKKARDLLEALLDPGATYEVRVEEFGILRKTKSRASYLLGVIYSSGIEVEIDMPKAIELFEKAAHTGDQDATMYLAITYAEGKEVDKSIEKAKEYFELLDLQSSDALRRTLDSATLPGTDFTEVENLKEYGEEMRAVISQTIVGMQTEFAKQILYSEGEDFDAEFAAGLLELAADGGYAEAQSELGVLYYRGQGVDENREKAASLIANAAEQGWVMAQYNLAVMIKEGQAIEDDQFQADEMLEFAANEGLLAAQLFLDGSTREGILNSNEAKELCLELAEQNDARALYSLARRKMMGWMVEGETDREKLVELFKQSADSGYSRAQYTMGMLHMSGEVVEQNIETAYWWLKSAAAQNHPLALHHIGICYAQGIVVEADIEQAFHYFSRSAELGLDTAKNSLAVFYNNGIHVLRNEWKASELYLEAADEGDPTAAFNIGNCYLEGKGVKRDVEKGLEWIARSAEQGNLAACSQMSRVYEEGLLADYDAVELAYWREKAAELGSRFSMKLTALNYFFGKGIPKNRGKAAFWISQYINSTGPIDTNNLVLEGEFENFSDVQKLLPQDYSALIVYADLMADAEWSGYDPEESYRILSDLASKGLFGARFRLAELHVKGGFSKANDKKAYALYKSLFDQNRNSDLEVQRALAGKAAYHLSICLADGIGIRASGAKAARWLEDSASIGYAQAQYELGKKIVSENESGKLEEGVKWLIAAANQGHHDSHVALARLNLENPISLLDQETIIAWLKNLVDSGSGEARTLLKRYGIEYKIPVRKSRTPSDEEKKEFNPYAPIEAA